MAVCPREPLTKRSTFYSTSEDNSGLDTARLWKSSNEKEHAIYKIMYVSGKQVLNRVSDAEHRVSTDRSLVTRGEVRAPACRKKEKDRIDEIL